MSAQLDLDATPAWMRGMNPEQARGVAKGKGPCALLAQAGSGKTRVVVNRIARFVAEGVDPASILGVTFSKKAADEMNSRLAELGVTDARVGTWHSLCLQILKADESPWREWKVDDDGASLRVLKDALGFRGIDWKTADPSKVAKYIGWCKAHLAGPESDFAREAAEEHFGGNAGRAVEAYSAYQQRIEERGILTFDDMLVFAHRQLADEANRLRWSTRWDYLIQDEGQDENPAQDAIAEQLARDHRNYMIVGDVAQAIYRFRGSSPEYLHGFAEKWGAETIIMNRNYRSGRAIVDVANRVIAPAAIRLPTDMICERGVEGNVRVVRAGDLDAEGEEFAAWVKQLLQDGHDLSSVCALFRTNAQSRALEEALLKARIPYVVVGGSSFYERKEVKDLLGYLRAAADRDPEGDGARRSLNAPFRYLGVAFLDRVQATEGDDWTRRVLQAAEQSGVQSRQRESALQWASIITATRRAIADGANAADVLNDIIHRTGYVAWVEKDQGVEGLESSHASNVRELARVAEKFPSVVDFLDYIDEMLRASRRKQRGDRVLLMSVHRSKGLEWPHVWVCGCNELLLPHAKGDPEEERRLMYVAVTRARDSLVLSYVSKFAQKEGVRPALPSRFLRDAGLINEEQVREANRAVVASLFPGRKEVGT